MFNYKKIISITMVLAACSTTLAYAEELSGSNQNTGSNSSNEVQSSASNQTTISNSNQADVNNNFNVKVNTGNNSASDNTGDASIKTGDISGEVEVTTTGNVNVADPGASQDSNNSSFSTHNVTINGENQNTGSNSNNKVETTVTRSFSVNNSNHADVNNRLNIDLNTGDNKAEDNTGDAKIVTGDIDFETKITTCLNFNFVGTKADIECPIGAVALPPMPGPSDKPAPTTVTTEVAAANQPSVAAESKVKAPGQVLAAAKVLPVTGTNSNYGLFLNIGLTMLVLGGIIRSKARTRLDLLA